jgi:head-tail adaptor
MDAGKLNTRVEVKTQTSSADGYGGFSSTVATTATVWAYVKQVKGEVKSNTYPRGRYLDIELIMRDKTVESNSITEDSILKIQGKTGDYAVTGIFESFEDRFVKIEATKLA